MKKENLDYYHKKKYMIFFSLRREKNSLFISIKKDFLSDSKRDYYIKNYRKISQFIID